jgi:hypothetical protein
VQQQQQQRPSASIDSVIGLNSTSSNSCSSSTESGRDAAHAVAATVAFNIKDVCVLLMIIMLAVT